MENKQMIENPCIIENIDGRTQSDCLSRIYMKVSEEGLSEEILRSLQSDIDTISGMYGFDGMSAVLLAAILEKTNCRPADDEDLAQYIRCSNIEFIRYNGRLRAMERAGIIQIGNNPGGRHFRVTAETMKAVESNCAFTPVKRSGLTAEELFSRIRKQFISFRRNHVDVGDLLAELDNLVQLNDHLLFCRKMLESALFTECDDTERRMFYYLCHRYVTHGEKSVDIERLLDFTEYSDDDRAIRRHIAVGSTFLQRTGLVDFALKDGFADTESLSLSDAVRADYFNEIELAPEEPVRHRDLVQASTIQAKDLYFNESERLQFSRLAGLLQKDNFTEVQQRLTSCGMRKGFNVIFYGAPGTGKTASVYELARMTGRDIFRVDMSKLRSKWVGESEKSVKGVFKIYRSLCQTGEMAPILLFNEADAIFAKRLENVEDSVDQMNNSIQNIILEEMENLEGILIATTNLLANLDPAFERRFIYKTEFRLPEADARAMIWKSMISGLSDGDAAALAEEFAFSGGNIENVARKSTVEYVLSGVPPTRASLRTACEVELLNRKNTRGKIGF